jgi:hypothetical protein
MGRFLTDLNVCEVDCDNFRLTSPLMYLCDNGLTITVEAGFVTDFASVPKWLPVAYALLQNKGRKAAVVHDKFYRQGGMTKEDADKLFLEALHACQGVSDWERHAMYYGVKCFGRWSYKGKRDGN